MKSFENDEGHVMDIKTTKAAGLQDNLVRVAFGVVVLIGLFWLIRASLTLIEPTRAYKSADSSPISARTSAASPLEAVKFDTAFDPFHRGDKGEIAEPVATLIGQDAPETDLNLELKGRRASGDGTGSATLKLPDGKEKAFVQGEVILRNVTLEAVYDSHIIISRNGVHERVTFKRNGGTLLQSGEDDTEAAVVNVKTVVDAPRRETVVVKDEVKAKFSDLTTEEVMRKLRFSPVREGNKVKGYRLQVRDRSFDLSEVGYQSGDLVTHISGQDLREGAPEFELIFDQIEKNPSAAVLTVDRNGEVLSLSLN